MRSETKFTKGEWSVLSRNNNDIQTTFIGVKIGSEYLEAGFWNNSQHKANAHLISAAPNLYDALEAALKLMEDNEEESDAYWSDGKNIDEIEKAGLLPIEILKARKALAKARGEL